MAKTKVAVTLDSQTLRRVDRLVRDARYPNRSQAIEAAVAAQLERLEHRRLADECAKLDPAAEQLVRRDLEDAPNNVEILVSLAEITLAGRRFKEALALTATALELRRDDYDALLIAAAAHARLGAPGDAIDALTRTFRVPSVPCSDQRPNVSLQRLRSSRTAPRG